MNIEGLEVRIRKGNGTSITYWKDGVLIGKRCTKCGKDKEINNFYFKNKKKGIYMNMCKECGDIKVNAWKKNNKENISVKEESNKDNKIEENISIKDYILWVKIFYKVNYFVYLQRYVGLC